MREAAEFHRRYPLWAARNCYDCQTYRMEEDRSAPRGQRRERIVRDSYGLKVLSEKRIDCATTPCRCSAPWGKPMMTAFMRQCYHRYRMSDMMSVLPKAGGLDDQNPIEMEFFAVLRSVDESIDNERQNDRMRNAGPLAPLLMLMGGGRRK